ncbi:hypothetical protein KKD40_03190 [Candidatus Micrarchaeota archaeon]|nr:hypothetical protein [Candidatus Micrarchaeota archaeon]
MVQSQSISGNSGKSKFSDLVVQPNIRAGGSETVLLTGGKLLRLVVPSALDHFKAFGIMAEELQRRSQGIEMSDAEVVGLFDSKPIVELADRRLSEMESFSIKFGGNLVLLVPTILNSLPGSVNLRAEGVQLAEINGEVVAGFSLSDPIVFGITNSDGLISPVAISFDWILRQSDGGCAASRYDFKADGSVFERHLINDVQPLLFM